MCYTCLLLVIPGDNVGHYCFQGVDLQKLILAHNNLETLREDLRDLSSLVVLNISHNNISTLPAAIGEYVSLLYNYDGRCCSINDLTFWSLHSCRLPLLKSLDVSFNHLSTLPEEIGLATALVK
jgi:Leucine-rich repeat (LRR) protein